MAIKDFLTINGRHFFWFVCQLIVLLICIWFIQYIYQGDIRPDEVVEGTFSETICKVDDKKLTEDPTGKAYRPELLLSYEVSGTGYQRWITANGLDPSFKSDRILQQNQLNRYTIGSTYPCWYDPSAPQVVVLVFKQEWFSTLPLFFPIVIALAMLYYMLRSIIVFIAVLRNKQE